MSAVLIFMLLAFAAGVVPQGVAVPDDAAAAIAAANSEWVSAMKAGDAVKIASPYAEDGVFVAADGTVVKGRDALRQLMRDRFARIGKVTTVELVQDGITRQGSLIYEWGHARYELSRVGAAPVQARGRYLTVWQKSKAGRWEIVRNMSLADDAQQ